MEITYTNGTKEIRIDNCPCHKGTAGHPSRIKGWGLYKGIKIKEEDIEEAKRSLFDWEG